MRPMMKDKIHKMAMISLAVFPVINSLYLEETADVTMAIRHTFYYNCGFDQIQLYEGGHRAPGW